MDQDNKECKTMNGKTSEQDKRRCSSDGILTPQQSQKRVKMATLTVKEV